MGLDLVLALESLISYKKINIRLLFTIAYLLSFK
jgi:hypothetical protein